MVKKAIGMAGIDIEQVYEAGNGREALEVLKTEWVDMVFTDLHMPEMSGIELVETMARSGVLSTTPVVVVSSDPSEARIEELRRLGVRAYLKKPFRPEGFRAIVEEVLEGRRRQSMPGDLTAERLGELAAETLEEAAFVFAEPADAPPPFRGTVLEARLALRGTGAGRARAASLAGLRAGARREPPRLRARAGPRPRAGPPTRSARSSTCSPAPWCSSLFGPSARPVWAYRRCASCRTPPTPGGCVSHLTTEEGGRLDVCLQPRGKGPPDPRARGRRLRRRPADLAARARQGPRPEVVGTAPDPYVARDIVVAQARRPHPRPRDAADGRHHVPAQAHALLPAAGGGGSSLTARGGELALEALAAGAVEVLCKPAAPSPSATWPPSWSQGEGGCPGEPASAPPCAPARAATAGHAALRTTNQVLAIGARPAERWRWRCILRALPPDAPGWSSPSTCPSLHQVLRRPARPGVALGSARPRRRLGRPRGGAHRPRESPHAPSAFRGSLLVNVSDGPRVNRHRPSVDVMFKSVAQAAGRNAVGVILTGMGGDGAQGLLEMRNAGARTIAQDEASCIVFGMPKVAFELGAAAKVLPLSSIALEESCASPPRVRCRRCRRARRST